MDEIEELSRKLVNVGVQLLHNELTRGTCGNISCRIPGKEQILVTPSGIPYEKIKPEDILSIDFKGKVIEGFHRPSVETPFHLKIYKNRDDVCAVVHTHSTYTLSVSAVAKVVPVFLDEIFIHIGGSLDVSPYAVPGSDELAENMIKSLGDKNAVLLSNHGAVCCGKNLEEAFEIAEIVEKICKMYIISSVIGKVKSLPKRGVKYQRQMFENKR